MVFIVLLIVPLIDNYCTSSLSNDVKYIFFLVLWIFYVLLACSWYDHFIFYDGLDGHLVVLLVSLSVRIFIDLYGFSTSFFICCLFGLILFLLFIVNVLIFFYGLISLFSFFPDDHLASHVLSVVSLFSSQYAHLFETDFFVLNDEVL